MNLPLKEIRDNPLLWPLAFVPAVLAFEQLRPEEHAPLFVPLHLLPPREQ